MASAFALAIFSGIGFLFGIQKSLRAFLNPLFTSRVVTENGICSAAFCESAALRGSKPSPSSLRDATSPEGRGFMHHQKGRYDKSSPLGGAGIEQSEMTERVSHPRAGTALLIRIKLQKLISLRRSHFKLFFCPKWSIMRQ